jgi:phosphoglycerol transferase
MNDRRPDFRTVAARAWPLAALLVTVALAWCAANGVRSPADLGRPPAYLEDPSRGDVVAVYAGLQAMREGDSPPFFWKRVRRLNAPFEAEWNDWPSLDELHYLVLANLARTFGVFGGLNTVLLLGHLLAAGTFYGVARVSGVARLWSFVGGLAYGLAPFMFAQSPHHSGVQWAWHVPLFTLVWRWVATDPGIEPWSRRFRQATGIGFLTGLLNVYFTNIFCQLTLVGAALRYLRTRSRPAILAALAAIAAAAAGFALSNVDTWTFKAAYGPNPGAFSREYKWLEIYGLKIKDLVIPPVTHRADALARFGLDHRRQAPLNDEDGSGYQGMVGIACLVWLAATAVSRLATGREKEVPLEAWQVLWIVLMFTTGGLNAIIGALGFTMFRTGCRSSIVILAITLLWAARRLTELTSRRTASPNGGSGGIDWPLVNAAAAVCLVILWDQVPRPPSAEVRQQIDGRIAADRDFTARMEEALPDGAMVFQLPVMEHPESPINGVPSYDHFRPYIFSRGLRFSFGSHKGRERERWQAALQAKLFEQAKVDQQAGIIRFDPASARAAVEQLEQLGFAAIYVNRNGFPDRGRGIEESLLKLGCTRPPIRSAAGDLECILLRGGGGSDAPPRP